MPAIFKNIHTITLAFCLVLIWGLTAILSQQVFWSDSEIWASTVARGLFSEWSTYAYNLKPLFNLILWVGFYFAKLIDVWPMQVARGLFFLNAAFIGLLVYLILKRWSTPSSKAPLFGVVLLSSSALFLERIYRVRSDIFVASLILFSIWAVIKLAPEASLKQKLRAVLPAFVAPFVTLNAVFFLPLLLPFAWRHFRSAMLARRSALTATIVLISLLTLIAVTNFEKSYTFLIESFDPESVGLGYFNLARFEHVFRWIEKDRFLCLLIALKLIHDGVLVVRNVKARKIGDPEFNLDAKRSWIGVWVLLVVLIHPNRLPFFLVSLLPFLILWITDLPLLTDQKKNRILKQNIVSNMVIVLASVTLTAFAVLHGRWLYNIHNNKKQKEAVSYLSSVIPKNDNLKIYDPVGILPFHNSFLWYLGPGQYSENEKVGELIQTYRPEIILHSQRIDWLTSSSRFLNGYVGINKDFFILKPKMMTEERIAVSTEEVLSLLWRTYSTLLDSRWKFTLTAWAQNGEIVPLTLKHLTGKVTPLEGPLFLDQLIFNHELVAARPISRIELIPVPTNDTFRQFDLYELFRFDAFL